MDKAYKNSKITNQSQNFHRWELLLVSKLGWDLSPVTACDFVDHLLRRVSSIVGKEPTVKSRATTFVVLAATGEYPRCASFSVYGRFLTKVARGMPRATCHFNVKAAYEFFMK
ncbi:hypothetical protein SK128_008383 [Halocaridina rubra]|uniref:Uncharacterized protein n=1 Tax=Halocaridina rubra TaxID=373956 RepID=A0AAN8XWF6_HALRR